MSHRDSRLGVGGLHEKRPSQANPVTPLSRETALSPTPTAQVGTSRPQNFVSCGQNQPEESTARKGTCLAINDMEGKDEMGHHIFTFDWKT